METDIPSKVVLQVGVPVDQTWLMKKEASLLVVKMTTGVLVADELKVLIDKDLVIVDMYWLIKPAG